MSARHNSEPKPVTERLIGRRTMLRAAILTVPVVAAFSRNAYAATDGHGCQKPTYAWCTDCNKCLNTTKNACKCKPANQGNSGCVNTAAVIANCVQPGPAGHARVAGENSSSMTSPFDQSQPAINDGGFNASPWR